MAKYISVKATAGSHADRVDRHHATMAMPASDAGMENHAHGGDRGFTYSRHAGSSPRSGTAKRENCAAKPSRNAGMSSSVYGAATRNASAAAPTIAAAFFSRSGDDRSLSSHATATATIATPPLY